MSIYKPTSWGRTRRPKAAHNVDKNFATSSVSLAVINSLTEAEFTDANGCYRTENQRYVHLMCSGSSDVTSLFGYNYASGYWHEIVTGSANTSVVVGNNQHQIVDINGTDCISVTGSHGSRTTIAFSTF